MDTIAKNNKIFYILDDPDLPTFYPDRYFVEKFAEGFALNGFKIEIAKSVDDIKENSIVMLYKHGFDDYNLVTKALSGEGLLNKIKKHGLMAYIHKIIADPRLLRMFLSSDSKTHEKAAAALERLSKIKNLIVIGFRYYHPDCRKWLDDFGIKYIISGVHYYSGDTTQTGKDWMKLYQTDKKAMPIKFAAPVDPKKVGENCCNENIKVSYVGNGSYGIEYTDIFSKEPGCKIILTPPYISEEEKVNIYKNSMISLGLQKNLAKSTIVTERIFESLAYGALCFTNNKLAVKATNGIAVYVENPAHALGMMNYYVNNPRERLKLREKGFNFIKNGHTYKHEADKFIKLAQKLYRVRFD